MKLKKVAVVGGTHGNEVTGTYLLRRWTANPKEITRPSFETKTLWANPKAFRENKRYIDADLNRSFSRADLSDETIDTYEGNRAKVINAVLGPKEKPKYDFTFDIHTTTSNMGVTLILVGGDQYEFRLAAFIKAHMHKVNLYCFKAQAGDHPYLTSITPRRLGLEIGPIPQGVLRHDIFDQANEALRLGLDYIEATNSGAKVMLDPQVEVFMHRKVVSFPLDADGNICGMVHGDLQDKDFQKIKRGDPLFITLNGKTLTFDESKAAYPVIALSLTEKKMMRLSKR